MKLTSYFGAVQNMGWLDRALRFVLGITLIGYVFASIGNAGSLGSYIYLPIIAIYPMMTAILGWDPLYHIGHVRSCQSDGRNACGTFPYEIANAAGKKMECGDGFDCSIAGNEHSHAGHQ